MGTHRVMDQVRLATGLIYTLNYGFLALFNIVLIRWMLQLMFQFREKKRLNINFEKFQISLSQQTKRSSGFVDVASENSIREERISQIKNHINNIPLPLIMVHHMSSRDIYFTNNRFIELVSDKKMINPQNGKLTNENKSYAQTILHERILKNLKSKQMQSLQTFCNSNIHQIFSKNEDSQLYKILLPHIKEKCFIVQHQKIIEKSTRDTISLFLFIDFSQIKDTIKLKIAKNYRNLYYTSVAHDIRTPVNGISGYNQALQKIATFDRQAKKLLQSQSYCCKALLYYSNSIQDLANMENGQFKVEKEFFYVRKSLNDVLSMCEEQIGTRQIKLEFYCVFSVPDLIYSDVKRIKQVLYQLVSNSIKYTQKGIIKVSVSVVDDLPIHGVEKQFIRQQSAGLEEIEEVKGSLESMPQNDKTHRPSTDSQKKRSISMANFKLENKVKHSRTTVEQKNVMQERDSLQEQMRVMVFNQKDSQDNFEITKDGRHQGGTGGQDMNFDNDQSDNSYVDQMSNSSIVMNTGILKNARFQQKGTRSRYLKLEVEDTGVGMQRKDLKKIFDLFQKTGSDLHLSEHTGVGIGLTLCKKVCEELGGMISLRSKMKVGTTFTCYFNISQPDANEESSSSSSSNSNSKSSCSQQNDKQSQSRSDSKSSSSQSDTSQNAQEKGSDEESKGENQNFLNNQPLDHLQQLEFRSPVNDYDPNGKIFSSDEPNNGVETVVTIPDEDQTQQSLQINSSRQFNHRGSPFCSFNLGQAQLQINHNNPMLEEETKQDLLNLSNPYKDESQNNTLQLIEDKFIVKHVGTGVPTYGKKIHHYTADKRISHIHKQRINELSKGHGGHDDINNMNPRTRFKSQDVMPKVKCTCIGPILIIDDNQFNLNTAKLIIEEEYNLKCDTAMDGQEGYTKIEQKSKCPICKYFKIVFIDINMPVMNGIELVKKLKEAEKNKVLNLQKSYLVAHTALPESSFQDFQTIGFNYFLEKPINVKKMQKIFNKRFRINNK